jgi:hypothetical protein
MAESSSIQVHARWDPALSRGLWLVKWLLLVPHYLVLALLWLAFPLVGLVAAVAILATGRYPRALFDFSAGVLRWSWRVHFYGYAALGTDRYPPFTLDDVPDYPARLDIPYPERLSRGLVLVKWFLAIPHLVIVGFLAGGGVWLLDRSEDFTWGAGGLIGVLVLVAGVVLLVTGSYPRSVFDLVVGLDRWVVRVAAYVALLTDEYPPFRLDQGGGDPGGDPGGVAPHGSVAAEPAESGRPGHWTAGRVVAVVIGAVVALTGAGVLTGGAGLMWADRAHRDADGFVSSGPVAVQGRGHALTLGEIDVRGTDTGVAALLGAVGEVRLRVVSERPVFAGVGPADAVDRYLDGVAVSRVGEIRAGDVTVTEVPGNPVAAAPGETPIWSTSASGAGPRTLTWRLSSGDWRVVVMNSDGSAGVAVSAELAAEAPGLLWTAIALLALGALLIAAGIAALVRGVSPPRNRRPAGEPRSEGKNETVPSG